jgi:hypothetical protein
MRRRSMAPVAPLVKRRAETSGPSQVQRPRICPTPTGSSPGTQQPGVGLSHPPRPSRSGPRGYMTAPACVVARQPVKIRGVCVPPITDNLVQRQNERGR